MTILALDYGGTFIKYGLLTKDAEILEKGEVPAPLESTEQFVAVTGQIYEQYKGNVEGVAISLPGIINSDIGYARTAGAYSKILQGKNICELLAPVVDVPVTVENDGKAAILAEMWKGALQGVENGVACIIGSGLGGGVLMDGKLRKGQHFASGEISVLLMKPTGFGGGNFAATAASMSGFLRQVAAAKEMSPAEFEISGSGDNDGKKKISGKDVFDWMEQGDEVTIGVYKQWLQNLCTVLFNMKMTLDPAKIVIGGGVSKNPKFIKDLKEAFNFYVDALTSIGFPSCELDVCRFSSDANLIGAVYNWLEVTGNK